MQGAPLSARGGRRDPELDRTRRAVAEILRAGSGKATLWSLQPLRKPRSRSRHRGGCAHPIDAFVLAKLRERSSRPPPKRMRSRLIRRLTYDLHGLPPAWEEIQSFAADRFAGRLRKAGGPAARLAALRRALGTALAGCGALRRIARLRQRQAAAQRLAVSRLCDPRVQRGQAVRALRGGAARGRRAVAGRSARRRLPPASSPPDRGISSAMRNCARARPTRRSRACWIATTW